MEDETFRVIDHLDDQDRAFLEEHLYAYNMAATGYYDGRDLAVFVRDEQGAIIAGLSGWTWGGCLKISILWVREDHRGKGYGRRLLQAAEAEGRARGCRIAALDTHSFQAPRFYQKLGWQVYGVLDDDPLGFKHYHLKKSL
jgi:GNAT superfamily N-acetyltransferase